AFEAYLNHVGAQRFKTWAGLERLSTIDKFRFICEMLNVTFPKGDGAPPVQTLLQLMQFRNTIAHGKSEILSPKPAIHALEKADLALSQRPTTKWEDLIQTADFAKRAREDVEAILTTIHAARPAPKERLFSFGGTTGSATS